MNTRPDILVTGKDFVDVYAKSNFTVGAEIIIQNKSVIDSLLLNEALTKPDATVNEGILVPPKAFYRVKAGSNKIWVRNITDTCYISVQSADGILPAVATSHITPTDFENKTAMNTLFGEATVGHRVDDVSVQFQYNISAADLKDPTGGVTGTASLIHATNKAQLHTGTGVGTVELESLDAVRYRPGHECIAMFTADFTAGEANTYQHIGIKNDNDGFYIGYDETEFGLFRLNGGSEDFVAQDDWEYDKLDGTGPSGFTLVPTKYNIFKISFGWLGIAPIYYSVYAGAAKGWVLFHVIDLVNVQDTTHIENPSLPISASAGRTSGTGSDLTINTSSWYAGVIGSTNNAHKSDRHFGTFVLDVTKSSGTTMDHLISLRNNPIFQGKTNHIKIDVTIIVATNSTNKDLVFKAYELPDVTFAAGPTFADHDADVSVMEVAKDTTTLTEVAVPMDIAIIQKNDQRPNTQVIGFSIYPGRCVVFGVAAVSSATGTVALQVNWKEAF